MDRALLKRVQTPQVFRSEMIREAYEKVDNHLFTDDASVFESRFGEISLVEGNRQNIKITTPTDLQLASLFIRSTE
jgi:2-C-methyl-D-erythritol 4-phosphate cytidylyltransferase